VLHNIAQVIKGRNLVFVNSQDDIPKDYISLDAASPPQSRSRSRTTRLNIHYQHPCHPHPPGYLVICHGNTEARPNQPPMPDNLGDHSGHNIHGHSKADAGAASGRAVNRGIHSDKPPGAVEKRPARIPRIDGGIGLNNPLDDSAGCLLNLSA
jgi:hypothetical protein